LKDELGFQGYVMSDWLGQRSGVASSLAGMDQTQPGDGASWANGVSYWGGQLSTAILNGSVPIDRLNDQVTRVVAAWYQLGQDQNYPKVSFSSWTKQDTDVAYKGSNSGPRIRVNDHIDVRGNHATIAKNVARDGITLLKNEGNVLPLSKDSVVRVFGTGAAPNPNGVNSCVDKACNKGTLGMGWGSGTADYMTFSSPIDAIKARASNTQSSISDSVDSTATQLASTANARCVVFVSADGGERYVYSNAALRISLLT
jgi:beta-glucosidase